MDVTLLGPGALRLKGKKAAIVVNPTKTISKTTAEGVLKLWDFPEFSADKVEEQRIIIAGAGDYEVGGIKVSGTRAGDSLVAEVEIDGVKILLGSGSSIEKISDKSEGGSLAIVNADSEFNYDVLTSIEPSALLVYGDKSEEVAKSLGKSDIAKVSKFSISSDRLPEEMQFVILG